MTDQRELEYYATPGPMTSLVSCDPDALRGLPKSVAELAAVVRGCIVDVGALTTVHGLAVPEGRDAERQIRPVSEVVGYILRLDGAPLVEPRPPERRFIGTCRNFATLTCALLRHTGTPARVRAGFAGYFMPDTWVDHWIIDYWSRSGERWVRVDPELDDDWLATRGTTAEDVAGTAYWSGAEMWQRCRRGEIDPNRCNMGVVNWGIGEVRGSVLYDIAALNQDEMLPWDAWAKMDAAYRSETDDAYDALLDTVGDIVERGDFDEIRALYTSSDDLRVPAALLPASAGS